MTDASPGAETTTPINPTLAFFADGWQAYQKRLVEAISPLTTEHLALRAAPNLRSVEELARHIVNARAGWFHIALGEGGEKPTTYQGWTQPGAPVRTVSELVAGLEVTWGVIRAALDRYTAADLVATVTGTRQGSPFSFQRGAVVYHVLEHDLHHGGEIGYSLGMHGIKGLEL